MIVETVRELLTALDAQGEDEHEEWEDAIGEQLPLLEGAYRVLLDSQRPPIDYSERAAQAAYVYRYVVGHADFIYQLLKRGREKIGAPLFDTTNLWVTSIGGGPGSELLGLLKYLSEEKTEPVKSIRYTIIDKEGYWETVVRSLVELAETNIKIKVEFQKFDVCDPNGIGAIDLSDNEIVFLSFFISEIACLPQVKHVQDNIKLLLSTMTRDSLILYNDSDAYTFYSFFNYRIKSTGKFEELLEIKETLRAESFELNGIFSDYYNRYNYSPKLSGKLLAKFVRRVKA